MSKTNYTSNKRVMTTIDDVVSFIGKNNCSVKVGKAPVPDVRGFKPITHAEKEFLTFCSTEGEKGLELIANSRSSVILCSTSLQAQTKPNDDCTLIFVENPRLWFVRCINKFGVALQEKKPVGMHPTANVESKHIGKNVYIGPNCYIAPDVTIGDNAVIHGGVYIYNKTSIGNNVLINSGVVIGEDGFGFEKNEKGKWEKFPHLGGVEIQDDIEIGANTCIDKGTLENTVIGSGTKIDNLVHIAHNVKVGKNCIIIAQSLVAGSCVLQDGAYVAMSACIREGLVLGKNCFVGMGAVVTKDVHENDVVIGVPARSINKKY